MKYNLSSDQGDILPNLRNISSLKEINESEFEGFLQAEIYFTEHLNTRTKFSKNYILKIHKMALGHLYSFAGKYRDVNMSKGGFPFASAKFLPETMLNFEKEILSNLSLVYSSREQLISDIAVVHGELLFIHPFREGNGRTARIIANLMARKAGYGGLKFEKVGKNEFEQYVIAVQSCASKKYGKMIDFISEIFPD